MTLARPPLLAIAGGRVVRYGQRWATRADRDHVSTSVSATMVKAVRLAR